MGSNIDPEVAATAAGGGSAFGLCTFAGGKKDSSDVETRWIRALFGTLELCSGM